MHIRNIVLTLATLKLSSCIRVLRLIAFHPILSLLSFWATVRAMEVAVHYFPKDHGKNGAGNAFRHSVWSGFLMLYFCKVTSAPKAEQWTLKVTDLHEELFPNTPLETEMDLHNNRVGIHLFLDLLPGIHRQFFERSFLVQPLLAKAKSSCQIVQPGDSKKFPNQLVVLDT